MSDAAARLAALALVATAAAAAAVAARPHSRSSALPPPAGPWRTGVVAAVAGSAARDACGVRFAGATTGLRSAALPCGVLVYVRFGRTTVLTEVVDHAPASPGATFDVTPALARLLDLRGPAAVDWRFTR